jgi:hypothetical protein
MPFMFHGTACRESIAAKLTANMITEAGASRVLAMDLHSGQCVGYFDIPVCHHDILLCTTFKVMQLAAGSNGSRQSNTVKTPHHLSEHLPVSMSDKQMTGSAAFEPKQQAAARQEPEYSPSERFVRDERESGAGGPRVRGLRNPGLSRQQTNTDRGSGCCFT